MSPSKQELTVLGRIEQLVAERAAFYESGSQTSVLGKDETGTWRNLLTKFDFTCRGESSPAAVSYKYSDSAIIRRLFPATDVPSLLGRLLNESRLDLGTDRQDIELPVIPQSGGRTRQSRSEWIKWPSDIYTFAPRTEYLGSLPLSSTFVAVEPPYYPNLGYVLWDFFGFRVEVWSNYFRGQVHVVIPDFRARISRLTLGLGHLRAEFDCRFLEPSELVAKVYAENEGGLLAQETVRLTEPQLQLGLADKPKFVSVVLVCKATEEVLDDLSYREGVFWQQHEIIFETTEPEIEQMLLIGESETLEFKERLDSNRPVGLARTAVAFANTKGGTIVIGVDDDHQVVGCEPKGMSDTVTNILRAFCDPPPVVTTEIVSYQGKRLFLIRVAESQGPIYTVKELGPYIRTNGTNRRPNSRELDALKNRG
ncbi:MAG TPA: ATP-binding protein [Methylomirabilota bacterium]|nr:ATP-binding protein [Methylomirabilota bacterium]